jgi:hypothetical protein
MQKIVRSTSRTEMYSRVGGVLAHRLALCLERHVVGEYSHLV